MSQGEIYCTKSKDRLNREDQERFVCLEKGMLVSEGISEIIIISSFLITRKQGKMQSALNSGLF